MGNQAAKTPAKPQEWENYTDLPVGEILRRTRMQYNLSLPDVESALRIRAAQLGAIETGRLDQLPGRVYAIGFVRAYSEFLGLDGNKMVHLFKMQSVGSKNRPELSFPVPASESKLPNFWILGGSFVGLIAVIMLFFTFNSPAPAPEIPPGPVAQINENVSRLPAERTPLESALLSAMAPAAGDASQPAAPVVQPSALVNQMPSAVATNAAAAANASQATTAATAAPAQQTAQAPLAPATSGVAATAPVQTAALTPAQSQYNQTYQPSPTAGPKIVLNILNDVWVEIRDAQGRPLLSRILKPGEQYVVPPGTGLVMDTGNAGAMDVYLGGKKLPRLGAFGNVKRNISLAPESLLATREPAPAAVKPQPRAAAPKPVQTQPQTQHNTIEPFAQQPATRAQRGYYRD